MSKDLDLLAAQVAAKLSEVPKVQAAANGAVDSLEYFYKVKNSNQRKGKKIHTYEFNEDIHKEQGLIMVPVTDVHAGSKHANMPYFKKFVEYIENVPNAVTILNGDLAETATKTSVGLAMFEEDMNIPEQIDTLYKILKPLADKKKILGMGPGNHEERVANLIGINPMQILADKLGVPYFGYQGFFRVVVNGISYKVVFHHGAGGGSTAGSKTNTSEKMNKVVGNGDLYFSGHTHGKQSHQDIIYMFDEESEELVAHIRTYVVGGSFVEYWGAYPEMKALAPSITGLVRCEFRPDRKEIRVTV